MSKTLSTLFLLTLTLISFGQGIVVDTLFIPRTEKFSGLQDELLMFPVIKTGNLQIDKSINKDIKDRFTHNEFLDLPTDSTIIRWANEGIVYLDFGVTFNRKGLISLNISAEVCGAYCTGWTEYFTYNTLTGKHVTIDQVIDTTGKFRNLVIESKDIQYKQQILDLKETLFDEDTGFDEDTYEMALEYYTECSKAFSFDSFALLDDHLEIIENCYLPHVIKSLSPTIELRFRYLEIKEFLRVKF